VVESAQSITRTLGMVLDIGWVLDWAGSTVGDWGDERRAENDSFAGEARISESDILVYVKALWRGCPGE